MSQDRLTKMARGKDCLIRLPGCLAHPETVVACHYRLSGLCGIAMKPISIIAAWGCCWCHAVCDGREHIEGWTKERVRLAFAEGVFRTQNELVRLGAIVL